MNIRKLRNQMSAPTSYTTRTILAATSAILALAILIPGQTPPAANPVTDVKTAIKATDDEWKVIGPALQAVTTARQAVTTYTANVGGRGGFGGPNFGTDSFDGPGNGIGGGRGRGGFGGPGGPGGFGGPGGPGGPGGFGGPDGPPGASGFAGRGGRGGRGAGFGGPGGPGGTDNAVSTALSELTKTLADTTSTPDQIKAKVAAVRTARQRAATDLAAAQKAILPLLTADQEATLVSLGYLD